ncbi:MAG: hypothetical protein MI754_02195, partial [Chromatiales bacterium]|nr:hypothetical protein [Chromatiales bacterium]
MGNQMQHQDVFSYFEHCIQEKRHPLLVELDQQHHIQRIHGSFEYYGFEQPPLGTPLLEALPFLTGMLTDIGDEPLVLPFIATPNRRSTDIHLFQTDSIIGLVIIDVTNEHDRLQDQQQLANELQLLKKRQEKLLVQLKEANSAQCRFIANMSHEFRTPLTSVLGYGDLLRDIGGLPEQAGNYLQAIERNAEHLLVMIDNLLDQAKVDAGALQMTPVQTELAPIFADLQALIEPLAIHKGLALEMAIAPDLPEAVVVDEMRLKQLLVNLAGNAIKYTDQGSIAIDADWRDGRLTVSITDT